MVNKCIVECCREEGEYGGFFKLPKKDHIREIWVRNLKLSDWFLTTKKIYSVCFRHFPVEGIKTSGKYLSIKKGNLLHKLHWFTYLFEDFSQIIKFNQECYLLEIMQWIIWDLILSKKHWCRIFSEVIFKFSFTCDFTYF